MNAMALLGRGIVPEHTEPGADVGTLSQTPSMATPGITLRQPGMPVGMARPGSGPTPGTATQLPPMDAQTPSPSAPVRMRTPDRTIPASYDPDLDASLIRTKAAIEERNDGALDRTQAVIDGRATEGDKNRQSRERVAANHDAVRKQLHAELAGRPVTGSARLQRIGALTTQYMKPSYIGGLNLGVNEARQQAIADVDAIIASASAAGVAPAPTPAPAVGTPTGPVGPAAVRPAGPATGTLRPSAFPKATQEEYFRAADAAGGDPAKIAIELAKMKRS